jgi:energy-coupling factor transporter ATP-binding protein EcfA2
MKLIGFQVFRYRNILDSGWIDTPSISSIVGQNECGKSNLLRALSKFSPFDESKYEINTDWPIDEWANKDPEQVVCRAKFRLTKSEVEELLAHAKAAPRPQEQPPPGEGDDATPSPSEAEESIPISLVVTVEKDYKNEFSMELPAKFSERVDPEKTKAWISGHLPKCVYMDDFATFEGHAELDPLLQQVNQRGFEKLPDNLKTILITLELAAIDLKDLVQKAGSESGRTLRGFDTNAASRHLTQRFKHKWKQKRVKFNIRVDGPSLDIHVEDEGLEAFVPLTARSRGFQWFVSFIWRFTHASQGEFENCILLLDEPGLHLHHAGHGDLLNFFEELAATNTVVYTTHLSTMLDTAYPERIKIMEVKEHHSTLLNGMVSTQKEPMMVIETTLGLGGGMSGLLGARQNLIVEGADDVMILHKLSGVLQKSQEPGLSDRIFLIPAKGAPKTPMFAGFMVGNHFDAGVLLDSDAAGEEAAKKIKEQFLKDVADGAGARFRILMLGDAVDTSQNEFAIEDLFPAEFYLECVNDAHGTNISETDLPTGGSDQICKRVEKALIDTGRASALDKQRVMRVMLRRFDQMKVKDDLPRGTYEKLRRLIDKINATFE